MSEVRLYYLPETCALVSLIALEQAQVDYETVLVRLMAGENKQPAFLAINPAGKVPVLSVNRRTLTENTAIVSYLDSVHPNAGLMPRSEDPMTRAQAFAQLIWCTATLHPVATRLRMPQRFAGPDNSAIVWSEAMQAMKPNLALIEQRLGEHQWMLGDDWSSVDSYVFWIWRLIGKAGVDSAPYPNSVAHGQAMRARPAVAAALAREQEGQRQIEAEGLSAPPVGATSS